MSKTFEINEVTGEHMYHQNPDVKLKIEKILSILIHVMFDHDQ